MAHRLLLILAAIVLLPGLSIAEDNAGNGIPSSPSQWLAPVECSSSKATLDSDWIAPPIQLSCTAIATCHDGSTRSCSSTSGTCIGIDHTCQDAPGYVQCGSTRNYCLACPQPWHNPGCTSVKCSTANDCGHLACEPPNEMICAPGCGPNSGTKYCRCMPTAVE